LAQTAGFRSADSSWAHRRSQYWTYLSADRPAAVFVAAVGGRAVGYGMTRVIPAGPTLRTSDEVGHVESLVVLPSYRSAGIGRALVDSMWGVEREWGASAVTVNVMAGNMRADQFYRRMGMVPYTTCLIGRVT
jgi:ribosomal protein S18 acetylase RimI-like enzyme